MASWNEGWGGALDAERPEPLSWRIKAATLGIVGLMFGAGLLGRAATSHKPQPHIQVQAVAEERARTTVVPVAGCPQ